MASPSPEAAGAISGDDGRRYRFGLTDMRGPPAQVGREVDFLADVDHAQEVYLVPGEAQFLTAPMSEALRQRDWAAFYLSWKGRVGRRDYWLYGVLALFVVNLVLALIPVVGHILTLVVSWAGIVLGIKRCHDVNRSGWWTMLPAVPVLPFLVGIMMSAASRDGSGGLIVAVLSGLALLGLWLWLIVAVLARAGDPGPNRFGPPP